MVGTVSPRLTPIPVTTPMQTRHNSLTTTKPMPADAPSPPNMPPDAPPEDFSAPSRIRASRFSSESRGERVDAEGGEELADDGVGLHLAAFQRVDMGPYLFVDELPHGVAHGDIDVRPFEHATDA